MKRETTLSGAVQTEYPPLLKPVTKVTKPALRARPTAFCHFCHRFWGNRKREIGSVLAQGSTGSTVDSAGTHERPMSGVEATA